MEPLHFGQAKFEQAAEELAAPELQKVRDLLGLGVQIMSPLDAHEILRRGLPGAALVCLIDHLVVIEPTTSVGAIGMSWRTFQRRRDEPEKPLSPDQSWRTWKFAEILAKATNAFGSKADAEEWLERPAIGLDQRRPIDLLTTPAGTEMVETFLKRIEYGVYT